jgi:hypothetical protein
MNKKMSFFRFCRWSLAALPVFLLFFACDNILPPSGNGVDIPVKIRAVSIAGGAQNEIVRAGGEKRIVGEPIIQNLGDGMLAEITVEEDVEALRADPQRLAGGKKFRVIAIDATTKRLYSYADYTVPSAMPQNGEISPDAGELHVLDGNNYDFICISYNSATDLPDNKDYEEGEELPLLSASISQEILYWRGARENDFSLNIVLQPQFTKVTLKINGGSKTITNIADNSISLNAATSGNFNLATGQFSSSGSINFFGWSGYNSTEVTSNEFTFLPQAKYTFSFAAEAISWEDGATTGKTTEGTIGSFQFTFAAGSSYTVTLRILRLPKFAGSNIYWDGNQLTFDPYGINNDHAKYQGVYFKWGSLIGVAAGANNESYNSGSTVLYKPTNTSDPVGTTRTWVETTDTDNAWSGSTWDDIPYYSATATGGKGEKTLLANPDFAAYKGDICNYIDENYRMPTGLEFDSLESYHKAYTPGVISVSRADGTYEVTTQHDTLAGIVFPASGSRFEFNGTLRDVGNYGYYWSGSANNGRIYDAYYLSFVSGGTASAYGKDGGAGFPVRCVLIE